MDKQKLISRLSDYANKTWSVRKQITHGHDGIWDKYPCANPEGPVDNSDCDDDDPLCNCPCQELMPDSEEQIAKINSSIEEDGSFWNNFLGSGLGGFFGGLLGGLFGGLFGGDGGGITKENLAEPTYEELEEAKQSIKECDLIAEAEGLGEEWLGCIWHNDDHPSSCNCPCVGSKFAKYLEYTRMQSTYWDTNPHQPIWRNAQMALVQANKLVLEIHGDLTLRPGTMIFVKDIIPGNPDKYSKIGGRWLIQKIVHNIGAFPVSHSMQLSLIREASPTDMNEAKGWESIMELLRNLIG
jgi:hypothetical protein